LRGSRSYAGRRVDVRELLDGRLVVLHDDRLCGEQPCASPGFILKPRRHPSDDRRRSPRTIIRAAPRQCSSLNVAAMSDDNRVRARLRDAALIPGVKSG
jgi:hypothetical protein